MFHRPPRSWDGTIVSVNLFGCVAFGVSAVAAYVLPSTGDLVSATVTNAATFLGALAFLVGAVAGRGTVHFSPARDEAPAPRSRGYSKPFFLWRRSP